MELVEETAAYLDGPGREDSRHLSRQASLVYASESMRLTTRLMQIASWLLLQRAVAEGEITADQAQTEKNRVRLDCAGHRHDASPNTRRLPERLRELIGLAARLHARILHLERLISEAGPRAPALGPDNPVAAQLGLLRAGLRRRRSEPATRRTKKPRRSGAFCSPCLKRSRGRGLLLAPRPRLPNLELKRDRRPPRSSSCCCRRSRPGGCSGRCRG